MKLEIGIDVRASTRNLRVVPGSHRWGRRPQEALADPQAPHPDEVLVTGRANPELAGKTIQSLLECG